ncbi:MAG: hypothetical protein H5T46_04645 [Archaeoglobi archaeon]|nr:hypothetical protein [Candidatus Mnemosynella sp.]
MPPPALKIPPLEFIAVEILYASVIFITCFLAYRRLREMYKISDYRSLHFFSNTFLFIGLAYFLRFIVEMFYASGLLFEEISFNDIRALMVLSFIFLTYASSAAMLYTIYSLMWKWTEKLPEEFFIHVISIILALTAIILRSPKIIVLSQITLMLLLVIAILINYRNYRAETGKGFFKRVYPLYILLFLFWLLNILLIFGFLPPWFRIAIYVLSISIILLTCFRILTKL